MEIFEPLLKPFLTILFIVLGIIAIIMHYFALFRIRQEVIKINELLENSPLNKDYNKKND